MIKRTVRSDVGEVTIRKDGLLYARAFPNAKIGLKQAREYYSMVQYLTSSKTHAAVINISGVSQISKDAREFLVKESSSRGITAAVALISKSAAGKMIGNLFLTVSKPNYPVRIFTDSREARHWAKMEYLHKTTKAAS
jgi:hypothetical protein